MLQEVSSEDEETLQAALSQLVEAELLYLRGRPPRAKYLFKHALIQDAAYESLLRSRRQQIHACIAASLRTRFPKRVENEPEVLAYHYSQARLFKEAAPYWLMAGQRAVVHSANVEAIAHLTQGLDVLHQLPDEQGASSLKLDMQISLGSAQIAIRGYSAVETEEAWVRGRELLDHVGEDARQFAVLHGLCLVYWNRAQLKRMLEVSEDMLKRANRQNDNLPKLAAHRIMAAGLNPMGQFEAARQHIEQAVALYDPERHQHSAHQFGHDLGVGAYWHLAIPRLYMGYPEASAQAGQHASELARDLQNANTTLYNFLWAAFTSLVMRDWTGAKEIAVSMIDDAATRSMALWVVFGRHLLGSALANLNEPEAALEEIHHGRDEAEKLNHAIFKPMTLYFEAQALSALNRFEEAFSRLDEALILVEATGERWWEAEIHRTRGEMNLLVNGPQSDSEASFKRAIEVAIGQNARLLELRGSVSLGHLWRDQGRGEDARDLLVPIYDWFTEGFDTADLKEAKALIEELA